MSEWRPNEEYTKVAEANRLYYEKNASLYDRTESCVIHQATQENLLRVLSEVVQLIGKDPGSINALDACGGTGNVALKLAKLGVKVTLSDISQEQLNIYRRKCADAGAVPRFFCSEVGEFLRSHRNEFDLIVFSSALHHLVDYTGICQLAYEALAPRGIILSLYDPTPVSRRKGATRAVLFLDYVLFKLRDQSRDVLPAVKRRLKRIRAGVAANKTAATINDENLGFLAEYHIEKGIDDFALVERVKSWGGEIVQHHRFAGGRSALVRKLVSSFGDATEFQLVIRKPR
jgi:ubiquinone/menaquinone biosynthesis C-methylase UbiE